MKYTFVRPFDSHAAGDVAELGPGTASILGMHGIVKPYREPAPVERALETKPAPSPALQTKPARRSVLSVKAHK